MIKKITGYWWFPDTPNKRYYGILKIFYSKNSNIELKDFFPGEKKSRTKLINTKYILGESEQGKNITLYDCFEYKRSSRGMSYFSINMVFIGNHFIEENDIKLYDILVEYQFLSNWFIKDKTLDIKAYKNGKMKILYQPQLSEIVTLEKNNITFKLQIITRLDGDSAMVLGGGIVF